MSWEDFLEDIATEYKLTPAQKNVFIPIFAKSSKSKIQHAIDLNISEYTIDYHMGIVYEIFSKVCPEIDHPNRGKFEHLKAALLTFRGKM